jgi:hypothetical protein
MEYTADMKVLQVATALRIQANTGLKHSKGSVLKLAKALYLVKGNTARQVLESMKECFSNIPKHW